MILLQGSIKTTEKKRPLLKHSCAIGQMLLGSKPMVKLELVKCPPYHTWSIVMNDPWCAIRECTTCDARQICVDDEWQDIEACATNQKII